MRAPSSDPLNSESPGHSTPGGKALPRDFDAQVLGTIRRLDDAAYGPEIARALERDAGKSVSRGALYTALDRLEHKGLVRWCIEEATADRGGLPRRRFESTQAPDARVGS